MRTLRGQSFREQLSDTVSTAAFSGLIRDSKSGDSFPLILFVLDEVSNSAF